MARDANLVSGKLKTGCAIIDTDNMAAFDFMVMSWVFQELGKMGHSVAVIDRLNLYTLVVVKNIFGKSVKINKERSQACFSFYTE